MPTALVPAQSVTTETPGIGGSTGDALSNGDGLPLDPCGVDKGKYDGCTWTLPLGNSKGITYKLHCDGALATDWSVTIILSQDDPDAAVANGVCMKNCDGWKGCNGIMEATPEFCVVAIGTFGRVSWLLDLGADIWHAGQKGLGPSGVASRGARMCWAETAMRRIVTLTGRPLIQAAVRNFRRR